jgi:hypothetical protein
VLRSPKALLLLRAASVLRLAVHKRAASVLRPVVRAGSVLRLAVHKPAVQCLAVHKRALPVAMVPLLLHRPVHMVLRPAKLVVMRRLASLISR